MSINLVSTIASLRNQQLHEWSILLAVEWPRQIQRRLLLPCVCTLTHLPLDKMAAILADDIFKYIFLTENDRITSKFSLKFVPMSPIDNMPALVQVMAWRRTGDKPLSEPMLTRFTDGYMRHFHFPNCSSCLLFVPWTELQMQSLIWNLTRLSGKTA